MAVKKPDVYTVTELTSLVKGRLERDFQSVTVVGEIGNWSPAASGHIYYSIKDRGALLSCVMWRSAADRLTFKPREGDEVECRGRLSVFEKRGQYQLLVDGMQLKGEGDLWAKFLKLKEKLEGEGLFDAARKRPIPVYPRCVGIVTSPTGAAIRDIINVMTRRAPSVSLLIYPARVQGEGAAAEIARGISDLSESGRVDAIIAGRGGGSLEDLWEFNDERVARAVYTSKVPVISAVGHETDFSISDFVADLRAPTPSAAAELVTAGFIDLQESVEDAVARCQRAVEMRLRNLRQQVTGILNSHALRKPELLLREYQQRTDAALTRMPQIIQQRLDKMRLQAEKLTGSLEGHSPDLILKKGYAIVRKADDEKVIVRAEKLKNNMRLDIELMDGKRRVVVTDDEASDLFG